MKNFLLGAAAYRIFSPFLLDVAKQAHEKLFALRGIEKLEQYANSEK